MHKYHYHFTSPQIKKKKKICEESDLLFYIQFLVLQSKWRMQRDRLTDEFSTALKNFQTIQRTAAEKERASVARARAQSGNYTKVLSWPTSPISPGKLL